MKLTDKEFNLIKEMVYNEFGIALTEKKKTLIESRFSNTLNQRDIHSFSEYFEVLKKDNTGTEMMEFVNRITTNHTFFFREQRHFDFMRKVVIPQMIERESKTRDLRIWSAGCSSGEEAYSIAMLLDDYFGEKKYLWDTQILATDISTKVLTQAMEGRYTIDQTNQLSKQFSNKYLRRDHHYCYVNDRIKREIIFRKFNLTSPFHFKKPFHLIFCRNVMIYFDQESKRQLLEKFYNALVPGGYLFIGHSESIENKKIGFRFIEPAIYQKI